MATKHPWFSGKPPAYLLVHRVFVDARGKDLPGRLQGDRSLPHELMDDSQIRQKFGAGRYRVTGRSDNGQLCGPPYLVDVADEFGRVPLNDENDAETKSDNGERVTMRDLLRASERRTEDVVKQFEIQLKAARDDRRNDLEFFSGAVKSMTVALASNNAPASGESRFESFMFKRLEAMEKDLRSARDVSDDWKTKFLKRGDSEVGWMEALQKAPEILSMFKGGAPGGGGNGEEKAKLLEELQSLKVLRERLAGELKRAEAVRKQYEERLSEGPREVPEREPLERVDPAEFDELLSGGGVLQDEVVAKIQELYAAGKVPAALLVVLRKHGIVT